MSHKLSMQQRRLGSVVVLMVLLVTEPALAQTRTASNSSVMSGLERYSRATLAWDEGDYPQSLELFATLLNSPEAETFRERIALFTGENWHTTLVAENARAPRWSPDGLHFVFDAGTGTARKTALVRASDGSTVAELAGTIVAFSPDGQRLAYVKGTAPNGATVERMISSGTERTLVDSGLFKAQLVYAADGSALYTVAARSNGQKTELFEIGVDRMRVLASADSSIADLQTVSNSKMLLYAIGRTPLGGGGAFARGARTRFAILDPGTGTRREHAGESPVVAAGGSAVAFIRRANGIGTILRMPLTPQAEPVPVHSTTDSITSPAISPNGRRIAFQQMPFFDWELFVVVDSGPARRLTREIQHDLLPRFIDDRRVLAVVGEARHRRAYLHDVETLTHTRLFHNNTVRTIAPEYEWVVSPDATQVLVVAERDGDTVTPHRHLWRVDMRRVVTVPELRTRIAENLATERALRADGARRFAPIAASVRAAVSEVSTDRVYQYEKALFDFDSKHVTQPGNLLAREYLLGQYKSFGLDARFQPFDARPAINRPPVPTANVLAVLRGTENPELVYVVASHFDSRAEGPGADDNTSGTAALLEAARVLSKRPQPATIIFASFTGEESGLLGSREFVRQAKADSLRLVGALNNDMLGWSNDNRLDNTIRYSNTGIRDIQHAAAFLFTRMITYDAFYYKSTDAAAFYDGYGDIVGGIGSYTVLGNPHYHMPHDLLEFENHQLIAEASKTTVATVMLLASSPSRIAGLTVKGTAASWTASPERGVTKYLVRYGPAGASNRWQLEVTSPRATLPNARAGMIVSVKAVNQRGLEGWDWATTTIQ